MISKEEVDLALTEVRRRLKTITENLAVITDLVIHIRSDAPVTERNLTDSNGQPRYEYLVNVKIPKDMILTTEMETYALDYKTKIWTPIQVKAMFGLFFEYYERVQDKPNGKWSHWRKVWYKWVRTSYDRETKGNAFDTKPTRFSRAAIRE